MIDMAKDLENAVQVGSVGFVLFSTSPSAARTAWSLVVHPHQVHAMYYQASKAAGWAAMLTARERRDMDQMLSRNNGVQASAKL
jgi:hypothetical protein